MHFSVKLKDSRLLGLLVTTIILLSGFVLYELKYFSTPLLLGFDGPYYYVQVSNILSTGHLKYSDPPLAFYVLVGFALLLGDVVAGIKIGSIIIVLIGGYAVYLIVEEITDPIGGVIASGLYAYSPHLARMSYDLIKNAMGITPLLFSLLLTYLAVKYGKLLFSVLSSLLVVVTGLTHVLDFAVIMVITLLEFAYLALKKCDVKFVAPQALSAIVLLALGFAYASIVGGDPYKGVSLIRMMILGESSSEIKHTILLAQLSYPLLIGLAGLISCSKLRISGRTLLLSSSIVLIALNMPVIPASFLWRFNLMSAALCPIILGTLVGSIGDRRLKVALALVVIGAIIPQYVFQLEAARPSISIEEYRELKQLVSEYSDNTWFIVPDVKLRYWVETLTPRVSGKLSDGGIPEESTPILIWEIRRGMPPFRGRIVFKGEHIVAYEIHRTAS